jgi:hypothetical protein
MEDVSGRFVLVVLRRDQVRVHHKKSKHEYRFGVFGDPPEVGPCTFHPNPAASFDPRDYRDDAVTAAKWFVANRSAKRDAPATPQRSGWVGV